MGYVETIVEKMVDFTAILQAAAFWGGDFQIDRRWWFSLQFDTIAITGMAGLSISGCMSYLN